MPTTVKAASTTPLPPEGVSSINPSHSFVYKHINGLVLNLSSIIKDDYFPGSRNVHLVGDEEPSKA